MERGDLVLVNTDGGKIGVVEYVRNGWIGVGLQNEMGRVDEWQPSQVRLATVEEAVEKLMQGIR